MKYAIISDVHANPAALEKVLADAEQCGVEQVVCAGDMVGYGPYPSELSGSCTSGISPR